jgi:hypothetical protein
MNQPELILLSPHQLPGQNPLVLGSEDMASWMNAFSALWHPAALWGAAGPPRVETGYDHEEPKAGHVYAVPETPPLLLPDDWHHRVREAGAVTFQSTPCRPTTLANLQEALTALNRAAAGEPAESTVAETARDDAERAAVRARLIGLPASQAGPFFGIGLGYLLIATLCEAMEHENLLAAADFWDDVQRAIAALAGVAYKPPERTDAGEDNAAGDGTEGDQWDQNDEFSRLSGDTADGESNNSDEPPPETDTGEGPEPEAPEETPAATGPEPEVGPEACRRWLQSAADRLVSAREVLYPVAIHLLDIFLMDDKRLDAPWPAAVEQGFALNVVAAGATLEKLGREQPERLARLREKVQAEQVDVCGGCYLEREDALLPVESQVWNLAKGLAVSQELLGAEIHVYARKRFGAHPQLPVLLGSVGLQRALLVAFDEAVLPTYQVTVVNWPAPDGKQIEAFTRAPHPADNPQTFFHLAHHLFQTIRQDHSATFALLHTGAPAVPWYEDWLELCRFGSVLGQFTTFSHYFNDVLAGEHLSSLAADEFQSDYLSERTTAQLPDPVSGFARHARLRRRLDTAWSLAALLRGLAGRKDTLHVQGKLAALDDQVEAGLADPGPDLVQAETEVAEALARRLLARAQEGGPGYLVLNPCSFARRVALELDGATTPLPVEGQVKACQIDGDKLRLVVEVPALGFCWFPKAGPPGTPPPRMRMRLADGRCVRNEFFEAEIDVETGGLRAFRDHRARNNRLGQRLVFNPGSTMRATSVETTSAGPALGEVVTEGVLLGEQEQMLARFRQRYRAWLGRPVLDLRIEIYPEQPPAGYPWHAYYGARFAWRDERATLLRGVNASSYITTQVRPQTPDYLELRMSRQSTVIFPGGLPFHQRHENRMLDVILVPAGEKAQVFDLALALDREYPMQTALGMITPVPLVPTPTGPPHVGAAGWLFHLDASNLLLTGLRPVMNGEGHPADAVRVRLLECGAYGGQADLRCPRDPRRAVLLDVRGNNVLDATTQGDAASFEVMPGDLVNLQVDFE